MMQSKGHVLILNTLFPPTIIGGAERSVYSLALGFRRVGWEVSVVTSGVDNVKEIYEGIQVYRFKNKNIFFRGSMTGRESKVVRVIYRLIDELSFLKSYRIYTFIKAKSPDVVFTNNMVEIPYHVLWFLGRSSLNHVHTVRDYSLMCLFSSTTRNDSVCEKQCISCKIGCHLRKRSTYKIKKVVGVSAYTLGKHVNSGFFVNSRVRRTIPNIYEDDKGSLQRKSSSNLRIGFIGLISDYKGVNLLFSALSSVSFDYEVILAGRESKVGYLNELSKKFFSVNYKYLGWVNPVEFYSQIDVVIMPAIWPEPYPRTLIESRVYGLPVIVSDSGGTHEGVINGEDGFVFKAGDVDSLHRFINILAKDHKLRESMSKSSLARSSEYAQNSIIAKYEEVFNK